MIRHRAELVALRSGLKRSCTPCARQGRYACPVNDLFGLRGTQRLEQLELVIFRQRVASLRTLIACYDREIAVFEHESHERSARHPGYEAIDGVGRILAGIFVAEIGDVTRCAGPRQLCSWTARHAIKNLTPRCGAGTSPSKARRWCAGPPSKPSPANADRRRS